MAFSRGTCAPQAFSYLNRVGRRIVDRLPRRRVNNHWRLNYDFGWWTDVARGAEGFLRGIADGVAQGAVGGDDAADGSHEGERAAGAVAGAARAVAKRCPERRSRK